MKKSKIPLHKYTNLFINMKENTIHAISNKKQYIIIYNLPECIWTFFIKDGKEEKAKT